MALDSACTVHAADTIKACQEGPVGLKALTQGTAKGGHGSSILVYVQAQRHGTMQVTDLQSLRDA